MYRYIDLMLVSSSTTNSFIVYQFLARYFTHRTTCIIGFDPFLIADTPPCEVVYDYEDHLEPVQYP